MGKGAFAQALRGNAAVFGQNVLFQGTGVHPDTDGDMVALQTVRHQLHLVLPADVAGVDAELVDAVFQRPDGQTVVKMDVCAQGHRALVHQRPHRLHAVLVIHRHPHQLGPGLRQTLNLGQGRLRVLRPRVGHGLNGNRRPAADLQIPSKYCFFHIKSFLLIPMLSDGAGCCSVSFDSSFRRSSKVGPLRTQCVRIWKQGIKLFHLLQTADSEASAELFCQPFRYILQDAFAVFRAQAAVLLALDDDAPDCRSSAHNNV